MVDEGKGSFVTLREDEFTAQLHLTLLRQLIDAQKVVSEDLRALNATTLQMTERVTKLETISVDSMVKGALDAGLAKVDARLCALEQIRQREIGAMNLLTLVKDFTPWILMLLFGAYLYLTKVGPPEVIPTPSHLGAGLRPPG